MTCKRESDPDQTLPGASQPSTRTLPVVCETVTEDVRLRGLAELASLQQQIDRAKRTLWALTAAARREPGRIEGTVAEIGRLERAQQEVFTRNIEAWMAARCEACRSSGLGSPPPPAGTPLAKSQP